MIQPLFEGKAWAGLALRFASPFLDNVTAVEACWSEFAQFMPHHVLGDIDGHMASTIVYGEGMSNHLRKDGGGSRPSAEDTLFAFAIHIFNLAQELAIYIWTFFQ
jgi:hypothetical protein